MSHLLTFAIGMFAMAMFVVFLTAPSDWCTDQPDHSTPTQENYHG